MIRVNGEPDDEESIILGVEQVRIRVKRGDRRVRLPYYWIAVIIAFFVFLAIFSQFTFSSQQAGIASEPATEPSFQQELASKQTQGSNQSTQDHQQYVQPQQILNEQTQSPNQARDGQIRTEQQSKNYSFPFDRAINKNKQLIKRITESMSTYQCLQIEPLFHQYDYSNYIQQRVAMYFQTYYEILLPSCENQLNNRWSVTRENIRAWNRDRFVVQWAHYHVQPRQKILYYREGVYNIPEIIMLSKMVGQDGAVFVLESRQTEACVRDTLGLSGARSNVHYVAFNAVTSFNYDAIVANDALFAKYSFKPTPTTKLIVYSAEGTKLRQSQTFKPFKIFKFVLSDNLCGKGVFEDSLSGEGFYSITAVKQESRKQLKKSEFGDKGTFGAVSLRYAEFKEREKSRLQSKVERLQSFRKASLCINPHSNRTLPQFTLSLYGHKLFGVRLQELKEWERQRQPIEWLRAQRRQGFSVYYEMSDCRNLLSVLQIAHLAAKDGLTVVCPESQRKRVQDQIVGNQLTNVKFLKESSVAEALLSRAVITDNWALMNACVGKGFLDQGSMLGFFTSEKNESVVALRKLYVRNEIREVVTPNNATECAGFEYLHYFWHSEAPHGFYEVRPSKYVVYSFWGGSPRKLNDKKRFLFEEMAQMDVQVKFIGPQAFVYFEVEGTPIHPAYFLLTSTHKSDYFRVYLMHHYGGAYADVKHTHFKWRPFFEQLEKDEGKFAYGYAERFALDVPCVESGPPSCAEIRSRYSGIMGNGHYIFKKQTPLTAQWFKAVTDNLNSKYEVLKKNPPRVPRQERGRSFTLKDGTPFVSGYPFSWAQIANIHLARAQYKFLDKIKVPLPYVLIVDYRTSNNLDEN